MAAIAFLFLPFAITFAYVTNHITYAPPDYTTFLPPAAGGSYIDPVFGTAIKRISNSMHTPDAASGAMVTTIGNEYSTMSPFNCDNTRLLLVHFSYFALYDGAGNFLTNLFQYGISATSEPRWSRTDPYTFYYVSGNQLRSFNTGTLTSAPVHQFNEYTHISGMGESDISFDGNSFVLAGDARYIFVYDIHADAKGSVLDAATHGFDSLYITPDNHVIVGWYAIGSNRFNGVELFDRNMNFLRQLSHALGHMDVTRDTTGEEVLIWANGSDSQLQVPCQAGVTKIRLSDAAQTCVWTGNWQLAVHVSAPDNSGWFFMETYAPADPIPPNGWNLFTDEILQVRLDGSEVRRLAHHRSRPFDSYVYQPKVATNWAGTKLVYASNFGLQSISGYPALYSDTYTIDLSSVTDTTPPPITPPFIVTRVEESASTVAYTGTWYQNVNVVHSGGSAALALTAGSRATLSFTGTGVNWIAFTDPWSGIANVYLDGVLKGEVDTYSATGKAQASGYAIAGLSNTSHTLAIEVAGKRNPASAANWVWVDAFDVSTPSPATITWAKPADIRYGVPLSAAQLNATASHNGKPVIGAFVYTPPSGTVLNAGAGHTLHVDFIPADQNTYGATSKDVTIDVLKADQTIAFGPLANKTYGDPVFTVNATASSKLPVSFSVSGSCSRQGNLIFITNAGSCTVTASQPGSANYLPAPNVAQSFMISKATPTLVWPNPADITYGTPLGATQLNAAATFKGSALAGSFIYTPAAGTVLNAGTGQALHASFTPSDTSRYNTASINVAINVIKAQQTITFAALSNRTFGDPPFSVSATASSNLPVNFSASGSCAVAGNSVTLTGAGTCAITASQPGNNNYNAAVSIVQSFTIAAPVHR